MMSEKRFYMEDGVLKDGVTGEAVSLYGIDDLLNEQQSTISSLQTELELTANTKLFSRKELERKVEEQQAEIERLQKIIDLTTYQLKVQDRIIQMEEKE